MNENRDVIDGKYTIQDEVGKGGMGEVFKVFNDGNDYTLKVCLDQSNVLRFKREVRLMKNILHENVIEVIDDNLDCGTPYFIMPLCRFSLDKKLEYLSTNIKTAIQIIIQVCKGVSSIHLSGVIHRDIKPQNILIDKYNKVKITDLGLGKFEERYSTVLTGSLISMGTMGFMPPEFNQYRGTSEALVESDIYQLGKTIYNIVTNSSPMSIDINLLDGGLQYIIQKCIKVNPTERYRTVIELQDALNNYLIALNPDINSIKSFESIISIAKNNVSMNRYDKDNIERIINVLYAFKNEPQTFFNLIKEIPKETLEILANQLSSLCSELLDIYTNVVDVHFAGCNVSFSDADVISDTMYPIFIGSEKIEVKIKAMKITLIAAVSCNRYKAMDVFDDMLQTIKDDKDSVAVVEMLKENIDYYTCLADRIIPQMLHPLIQSIQMQVIEPRETEDVEVNVDFEDFFAGLDNK